MYQKRRLSTQNIYWKNTSADYAILWYSFQCNYIILEPLRKYYCMYLEWVQLYIQAATFKLYSVSGNGENQIFDWLRIFVFFSCSSRRLHVLRCTLFTKKHLLSKIWLWYNFGNGANTNEYVLTNESLNVLENTATGYYNSAKIIKKSANWPQLNLLCIGGIRHVPIY